MTQLQILDTALERAREVVDDERLNIGTARMMAQAAYQDAYALAVAAYPEFFTTHTTFGSTALLAVPANCYKILAFTLTGGVFGGARILDHRTPEQVNRNAIQQGVAGDPVAVWTGSNVELTPAFGGVMWFIWNFGEITDDTTEITQINSTSLALLPKIFEEKIIMDLMSMMMLRFNTILDTPTSGEQGLELLTAGLSLVEQGQAPDNIFGEEVQRPGIVPNPKDQQQ